MSSGNEIEVLRRLLPSLDSRTRTYLHTKMAEVRLAKDEVLFRQGDPTDALYVVVRGWLGGITEKGQNEAVTVSTIGPGESVGENGLISGSPRSLTVKALTGCNLLRLSEEDFVESYHRYPSILRDLAKLVVQRNDQVIRTFVAEDRGPRCIALIRSEATPTTTEFLEKFAARTSSVPGMTLVTPEVSGLQHHPLGPPPEAVLRRLLRRCRMARGRRFLIRGPGPAVGGVAPRRLSPRPAPGAAAPAPQR